MTMLITITEMPTMPGYFSCRYKRNGARKSHVNDRLHGPEAAAAAAVDTAMTAAGGYMIFAPKSVLDHIPAGVRARDV